MLVYRVEHPEGGGPYIGPNCITDLGFRHSDGERHPNPSEDGIQRPIGWSCGFSSLTQYQQWFNREERQELKDRPTLIVVLKDGTVERVGMRSLRIARTAAFQMNQGGNYRAAFAMWR
jgi:hypothetical protein